MSKGELKKEGDKETQDLQIRDENRALTLKRAITALIYHFFNLDPVHTTDPATALTNAKDKVDAVSDVLLENHLPAVIGYERGNRLQKQKLIDGINAISEVTYPYFDATAKALVVDNL